MAIKKAQRQVLEGDWDRTVAWIYQQFPSLDDTARGRVRRARSVDAVIGVIHDATGDTKVKINAALGKIADTDGLPPRA